MEKQVLSIAQCKELVALGLDMSCASMCYSFNDENNRWVRVENYLHSSYKEGEIIPTFTLQDILEILPKVITTKENNFELYLNTYQCYVQYRDSKHNKMLNVEFGDYILEAAFNMLKWCIQNKYI